MYIYSNFYTQNNNLVAYSTLSVIIQVIPRLLSFKSKQTHANFVTLGRTHSLGATVQNYLNMKELQLHLD